MSINEIISILCNFLPYDLSRKIVIEYRCLETPSCKIIKPLFNEYKKILIKMKAIDNLTIQNIYPTVTFYNTKKSNESINRIITPSNRKKLYIHTIRIDYDNKFWWLSFLREL